MKLQTKITLQPQQHNQIDYNAKILLLGSCFSENMGEKFKYNKFQSFVNPFGILFHPAAIENLVKRSVNKNYYSDADLHFQNEQWCCLDAHSKLNRTYKEELLQVLNAEIDKTRSNLISSSHIIITLGTSWVYRHMASDSLVANCHKILQNQFSKELLSVEAIEESLKSIINEVKAVNPKVNFLFTVSPVRHLKDGFVENTRSKSHLITAIHNSVESQQQVYYFPSYEIMMDELRDYRFYNADMLHPNDLAVQYIWDKFKSVWLTEEAIHTSIRIASIQAKKAHRPFNFESEAHREFLSKLQIEIDELTRIYPHISF